MTEYCTSDYTSKHLQSKRMFCCLEYCKFRYVATCLSNLPMNIARLIAMLQYSGEQNTQFDCKTLSTNRDL